MKFVVLVGDGMADRPIPALGGQTPLAVAHTPNMDFLAANGRMGTAVTIPVTAPEAGSDVGNLSILGYDPLQYRCGRGPLEAANIGVDLGPLDVAFRCNLVTRDGDRLVDYSAGHISTEEAGELVHALIDALGRPGCTFYPGVSYRHLFVWQGGPTETVCHPPHDFTGGSLSRHWPDGRGADVLGGLIRASWEILSDHRVNRRRLERGDNPANSIWFWGQGRPPRFLTLLERFGIRGAVISAVDLINGLGRLVGLVPVRVPGATGYLDSDFPGKVRATLHALEDFDLVYVHVEAPDEAGHEGSLEKKIAAIELFDGKVVGPIMEGLKHLGLHRILVLPDHYTPLAVRTHTREPVPFIIYDSSSRVPCPARGFTEQAAASTEWQELPGTDLLPLLMKN